MIDRKLVRYFFSTVCIVLIAYSFLPLSLAIASPNKSVFQPILTRLQETKIPLRLPTDIASEKESNPIYAVIDRVTPSQYQIFLAYTQDCQGENFCRYGTITGEALSEEEKTVTGESVLLTNGIQGYFHNAECHAYCTDSVLSWKENGYLYSIGVKAANKETLIRVANSALKNPL